MKNTAAKSRYSKILQIYHSQISEGECRCVRKIPMNIHRGLSSEPVHIILALSYCFPFFPRLKLVSSYNQKLSYSRAFYRLHAFPALFTAYMLFPRFLPLTCFSRARHQIRNFPRLALATCFPALETGYTQRMLWSHYNIKRYQTQMGFQF